MKSDKNVFIIIVGIAFALVLIFGFIAVAIIGLVFINLNTSRSDSMMQGPMNSSSAPGSSPVYPMGIKPAQTSSKYDFSKGGFDFNYISSEKVLRYSGNVQGNNGCARLGEIIIEKGSGDEIKFAVNVEYAGEICTQQIVELRAEGEAGLELTTDQQQNLEDNLEVVVTNDYKN